MSGEVLVLTMLGVAAVIMLPVFVVLLCLALARW